MIEMKRNNDPAVTKASNILVAYFSHSRNTYVVAETIHGTVGGDIFEIAVVDPYPRDHDAVVEQARKELSAKYRPELKTRIENMGSIQCGVPWLSQLVGSIPMPVATFLSEYDLSGKTLVPFCTHEGSSLGRSVEDVRDFARDQPSWMAWRCEVGKSNMQRIR